MAHKRCKSEVMEISHDIPDMVGLVEQKYSITVHDTTPDPTTKKHGFQCRETYKISDLFGDVGRLFCYKDFELILQPATGENSILLNDKQNLTLKEIPELVFDARNTIVLAPPGSWENNPKKKVFIESPLPPTTPSDDDLALGASANPVEQLISNGPSFKPRLENKNMSLKSESLKPSMRYVGLVNQAMTCYLNSLLQALFMTPEFRNALYKMEFNKKGKSIPFQLQKLFVNLQTSSRPAVETTDLTRSFGWDSTQAWTQHDIQELCRVMFDALEKEFQRNQQENWINKYYEGKMIDYVKCLECGIEKTREDKFLDIPLPVRPFGSTRAYESVEEALRAFVQPETLDGNNQYFCEKCNKKCDAHKGLKFKDFPYILTLHLKRFDFDYQTLHRIKLNDKVTFPQTLNLNCFINATDIETFANLKNNNHAQMNGFVSSASSEHENGDIVAKSDDCSTTDSGAALEEDNCSGFGGTTASSSHHENELQEDDEGIDLITGLDRCQLSNTNGPYIYELFAIMVHSGSASGGHYYAYIKDFETGEWNCFNDQTVSPITQEDIQKSFGGDSFKAYYSGLYSSSTNAYMLMYRRLDPEQNEKAITVEEFSRNIVKMREHIHDTEQEEKRRRIDTEILKPKVFFYNPQLKRMKDAKVYISRTATLENTLEVAYEQLKVHQFAPLSRCRLVAYDHYAEQIECSFEGKEKETMENIPKSMESASFLLETRLKNEEFESYNFIGLTLKSFKVDLTTMDLDGPYLLKTEKTPQPVQLKKILSKKFGVDSDSIIVVVEQSRRHGSRSRMRRVLFAVETHPEKRENASEVLNKLATEDCPFITYLYMTVPPTDQKTLESLCIPPYKPKDQEISTPKQSPSENVPRSENGGGDVVDAVIFNGVTDSSGSDNSQCWSDNDRKKSTTLPLISVSTGHESNSEDSSLSDGDRTLVESTHNDLSCGSSPSHSPQLSSPEDDIGDKVSYTKKDKESLYFRATEIKENEKEDNSHNSQTNGSQSSLEAGKQKVDLNRNFKVFVDDRMTIEKFKICMESIIGVPAEHFKITSCSSNDTCNFNEGEQVNVELERSLKHDEIKAKIYYLKLSELTDYSGKLLPVCQYVLQTNRSLVEIKMELIAQLHKLNPDYQNLKLDNCRLWRKWGRNPDSILSDDSSLIDLNLCRSNCEVVVQECEENANMNTTDNTLTLFLRRWDPSTLTLSKFHEITLDKHTNILKALASVSDINEEDIAYKILPNSLPYTDISVIDVYNYEWYTDSVTKASCIQKNYESGSLCIYKNNKDPIKPLTEKEKLDIKMQERRRIDANGGSSNSILPRVEHALKIYLDSPPKRSDD